MRNRSLLTVLAAAALLPAFTAPALATGGQTDDRSDAETYQARLDPVPHHPRADGGSDVNGHAELVLVDGKLKVEVEAYGLSPLLPHLMHIHGELEAQNECPGPDARKGGVNDRLIETVDGLPAYGPIQVTFSTEGDTSPDAALSLDTAPVADRYGNLYYQRVLLDVPDDVLDELDDLHIVIHGADLDGDGMYDATPVTELGAPLEAELPVACGQLENDSDEKHDPKHDHGDKHGDKDGDKHGHGHGHGSDHS